MADAGLKTIIIVGAGNLGSRHLQGLGGFASAISVWVVDPSQAALDLSRERAVSAGLPHDIHYLTQMPAGMAFDCAILACNSNVRASVTKQLCRDNTVKAIVFEKVLFDKIQDYAEISALLKASGIKAWVNCPRRIWPVYEEFRQTLTAGMPVHIQVSGSLWGLGCNSIHFLDLMAFLNGTEDYQITNALLDKKIIDSKRHGFIEFTGGFSGFFSNGGTFLIQSYADEGVPYSLTLKSAACSLTAFEDHGLVDRFESGNWQRHQLTLPYQSQLTGNVVEEIVTSGQSRLTPYSQSVNLHLPMLQMFLEHYNLHKQKEGNIQCPIT
jgi:predicted dehydrogenase